MKTTASKINILFSLPTKETPWTQRNSCVSNKPQCNISSNIFTHLYYLYFISTKIKNRELETNFRQKSTFRPEVSQGIKKVILNFSASAKLLQGKQGSLSDLAGNVGTVEKKPSERQSKMQFFIVFAKNGIFFSGTTW